MKELILKRVMVFKKLINTRGDTIVEVMISMAVLGIVIAAAYATSSKTYNSSLNSQYRDQAVSYAQQQLELIKEADNNTPSTLSSYTSSPGTPFCINPATKAKQAACTFNSQYVVTVTYDSGSKSFRVATSWQGASSQPQSTALYYKANDSFSGTPVTCTDVTSTCTSTLTNPPSVGVNAAQSSVNPLVDDNISWTAINIQPGSCTATGPGSFAAAVDSSADPGSYVFNSNTPGSYNFSINCTDNAGHPITGYTAVTVLRPLPQVTTGSSSGTSSNVTYNSATLNGTVNPEGYPATYLFNYGPTTDYGLSAPTPPASAGSGTSTSSVSVPISGLNSQTTYHFRICATNAYGTACGGDATLTTAIPPPSVTSFYASPSTAAYGGGTTLYWSSSYAAGCLINNVAYVGTSGTYTLSSLTATTTYQLACYNSAGIWTGWSSATVIVNAAPSVSSFSASPSSIAYGGSSTLSWSSNSTTGCLINNVAYVGPSGSYSVAPTSTTTYQLACYNSVGIWTGWYNATVVVSPPPSLASFSASPTGIQIGGTSNLSWSSSNTTGCLINNVAYVGPSGSYSVAPTSTTTYQLACYNSAGIWTGWSSATVTVYPPTVNSFYVSPTNSIAYGGSTGIYWSSSNTAGCLIDNLAWVGPSGSTTISPTTTTTYGLHCYNSAGYWSGTSYLTVYVGSPPTTDYFYASPNSITYGAGTTLYWSSSNTSGGGCLIDNVAWVGTSGGYNVYPTSTTTYSVHCYNSAGAWSGSLYATVYVSAPPSVDYFYASPNSITYGGTSTLYWSSSATVGCLIDGVAWVGTSGSYPVGPGTTTNYSIHCYNSASAWSGSSYATVYVSAPPSVDYFYASPNSIGYGAGTNLYWSSSATVGCLIDGVAWVGTSGGYTVYPSTSTNYSIHCYNSLSVWSGTSYAYVYVAPPPYAVLYQCTVSGRYDAPCSPQYTGCSVTILKGEGYTGNPCGTTIMGSIQFFNSPGYYWPVTIYAQPRPDLGSYSNICENFYFNSIGLNDGISGRPPANGSTGYKIYRNNVYAVEGDYTDGNYGNYGCSNQNH